MNKEVSQVKGEGRSIPTRVNNGGKGPNFGNSVVSVGETENNIINMLISHSKSGRKRG